MSGAETLDEWTCALGSRKTMSPTLNRGEREAMRGSQTSVGAGTPRGAAQPPGDKEYTTRRHGHVRVRVRCAACVCAGCMDASIKGCFLVGFSRIVLCVHFVSDFLLLCANPAVGAGRPGAQGGGLEGRLAGVLACVLPCPGCVLCVVRWRIEAECALVHLKAEIRVRGDVVHGNQFRFNRGLALGDDSARKSPSD